MPKTFPASIFAHRHTLWSLALHDFRSQYLDSFLGFFWAIIKPLVMIGIYVVVFSSVAQPGEGTLSANQYGFYIFAGMLPWLAIQESLLRGSTVMQDFAHLIRHHPIPLYLLPCQLVLSATVTGILATLAFVLLKTIVGGTPSAFGLLILVILPVQTVFCFGLSLLVSLLTVFLRDTQHFLTAMLTVWFFASPIVFPAEALPGFLQGFWSNPLVGLTEIYRHLLLAGTLPPPGAVIAFSCYAAMSLGLSLLLYARTRKEIIDWL